MKPSELTDANRVEIEELLEGVREFNLVDALPSVVLVGRWLMMTDADRAAWLAAIRGITAARVTLHDYVKRALTTDVADQTAVACAQSIVAARVTLKALDLGRALTTEEGANLKLTT